MKHFPLIRTIYLYLFSLVGLALLTIGMVRLVDLGLKILIFKKAEQELYKSPPPVISLVSGGPTSDDIEKIAQSCKENSQLSLEERKLLTNWLRDYKEWKEGRLSSEEIKNIKRQRTASLSFSFILIGLPLYLYHWRIIKKETSKKEEKII